MANSMLKNVALRSANARWKVLAFHRRRRHDFPTDPWSLPEGQGDSTNSPRPDTVKDNVKNVHGWKGGAERGFLAAYPDCIHKLTQGAHPDLVAWNTQVLTYNLSARILGPRFGMLVPITYYQLGLHKDEMHLAHVLGWCVELLRASRILCEQTIAIDNNTTNVNRPFDFKPAQRDTDAAAAKAKSKKVPWGVKHNLGSKAFSDAMLLDNSALTLIGHYFKDDPRTLHFFRALVQSFRMTTRGRCLEFQLKRSSILPDGSIDLGKYDITSYKTVIRSRSTFTNYCLPVSLALHLEGISQKSVHDAAYLILNEMGHFTQTTHDFDNCFLTKHGDDSCDDDIRNGCLTWLLVVALQRVNPRQRKVMAECYGDDCPESAERVREVYKELKLKKSFQTNIEETKETIINRIQQISKVDSLGLSQEFFFRLMESMRQNDIP